MAGWRLDDVVSGLQTVALAPGRWRDCLAKLSAEVGGAGAVLFTADKRHPRPICTPDLDELTQLYEDGRWHERDLRYNGVPAMMRNGIMTDLDCLDPEDMRRSDYYQDFLRKHRRQWFAGVGFQAGGDLWAISVQRTIAQGAFEPEELEKLKMLWRPLTDAATLSRVLGEAKIESTTDALELVSHAALACDHAGAVMRANREAERLLGPLVRGQRLTFKHLQSAWKLAGLLDSACARAIVSTNQDRSVTLLNDQGERITIRAICLEGDTRYRFAGAAILLLVKAVPAGREEILQRRFQLTTAETAVSVLLLDGHSLEEIAAARGISVNTVRAHLKSIFTKTGSRSQAHFIAQGARLIYASD